AGSGMRLCLPTSAGEGDAEELTMKMLSADAQVVVLLCASLNEERTKALSPLTPREYHRLASALHASGSSPQCLKQSSFSDLESLTREAGLGTERVAALLDRGVLLAMFLEAST